MKQILFITILLTISCVSNSKIEKDNYFFIDNKISNECTSSMMVFPEGKMLFRYALSGTCNALTIDQYSLEYEKMITEHRDSISIRNGVILFNHYFSMNEDSLIQRITHITSVKFNKKAELVEKWGKGGFTLEIK